MAISIDGLHALAARAESLSWSSESIRSRMSAAITSGPLQLRLQDVLPLIGGLDV
jgi:hypothetical protein